MNKLVAAPKITGTKTALLGLGAIALSAATTLATPTSTNTVLTASVTKRHQPVHP